MVLKHHLFGGLLCLAAIPTAFGCAFHASPEMRLESMHPGSLSVAVALRKAADNGVIEVAALGPPARHATLYIDAVGRLHAIRKAIAASPAAADLPTSFSLGYVESWLWTRYSRAGDRIRADIHTDGPADGEAVVLTGEPVVSELLAGRLSIERALAEGLLFIDGSDAEQTAIRRAFDALPPNPELTSR